MNYKFMLLFYRSHKRKMLWIMCTINVKKCTLTKGRKEYRMALNQNKWWSLSPISACRGWFILIANWKGGIVPLFIFLWLWAGLRWRLCLFFMRNGGIGSFVLVLFFQSRLWPIVFCICEKSENQISPVWQQNLYV